jgi:membrane-anchored glycerophosphoryl diester phosphodiesterase (GDPDase)
MNPGITEEVGMTARNFMNILRTQPLSLALVVMNFVLVAYVFYSGSVIIEQRKYTTDAIINWQREADKLMAQCVSTMARMTETLLIIRKPVEQTPVPMGPMPIPMPPLKPEEMK